MCQVFLNLFSNIVLYRKNGIHGLKVKHRIKLSQCSSRIFLRFSLILLSCHLSKNCNFNHCKNIHAVHYLLLKLVLCFIVYIIGYSCCDTDSITLMTIFPMFWLASMCLCASAMSCMLKKTSMTGLRVVDALGASK